MPQNGELGDGGNVDSEEGNNSPKGKLKRGPALRSVDCVVSEIMKLRADPGSMEPELERLIGGVINKEVEFALANQMHLCNEKRESANEIRPSKSRSLQLEFFSKLSLPVLTGRKIKGEGDTIIRVALVDCLTRQVSYSGPEASAKVEIVVLEKDFNGCEGDNWSLEEFNSKIVREWEGRKSPLTGDIYLNLKEGIGFLGHVSFKHTKRWMKRCEFRLGARIVGGSHGVRVREAKTEPFIVEDRRGKLYQKYYPPSLSDAVWRLEKIAKDGAFHERLSKENINTVQDFVTLLNINPQRLKDILGGSMTARMWDITVGHARTCKLDKRTYLYYSPISQQKTCVVFDVVGQLMGLLREQQFIPVDKLSETEKDDAHKLLVSAFQQWGQVVLLDDEASLMSGSQLLNKALYPLKLTTLESPSGFNFGTSDVFDLHGNAQQDTSSTDVSSLGGTTTLDDFCLPGVVNQDYISGQPLCFQGQINNSSIFNLESLRLDANDEHLNLFRKSGEEVFQTESRSLQLRFLNNVSNPVFIGFPIEGEDHTALKIALHDAMGQVVCSGPASSAKVEIVVFDDSDGNVDSGKLEESKNNITREREGKKLLLTGDTLLDLKEGIGRVGEIFFTEDSNWTRSCILRLGARVVDNGDGIRVRGAKTDPFTVRDQNRDCASSHDIVPSICSLWDDNGLGDDDLQSIGNIIRRYEQTLTFTSPATSSLICDTESMIQAFCEDKHLQIYGNHCSLQSQNTDCELKGDPHNAVNDILLAGSSALTINKAKRRHLSKKNAQRRWRMLFSIMRWFSVRRDVARRTPLEEMHKEPNASSQDMKLSIYSIGAVNSYSDHCFLQYQSSHLESQAKLHSTVNDILLARSAVVSKNKAQRRYLSKREKARRRWRMLFSVMRWFSVKRKVARNIPSRGIPKGLSVPSGDTVPSICSTGGANSFNDDGLQLGRRHEKALSFPVHTSKFLISDEGSMTQAFCEDEHLQLLDTCCSDQSQSSELESPANLHSAVNDTPFARFAAVGMNRIHRRSLLKRNKAQRRWRMLFSVVRWFSVRRNVARKTSIEETPFKLSISSQDTLSSISSTANVNIMDNKGLQSTRDTNCSYKQSMPVQVANSLIRETESMTWGFCEDEHLEVVDPHRPLQSWNSTLGSRANLHDTLNDILLARSTAIAMNKAQKKYLSKRDKARRRWRMLFSVVRWFSVRRNVARKGHVMDVQRFC